MKRIVIFLILVVFWSTGAAYAGTWTIQDDYIGATILPKTEKKGWVHKDGDVIALSNEVNYFDIDFMTVAIEKNGDVTVEINTDYTAGRRGTDYGDLFLSTNGWNPYGIPGSGYPEDRFGLGETWEYALNTSSGNIYSVNPDNIQLSNEIMTALNIPAYHYRNNQEVLYNPGSEDAIGSFAFSHAGSLISYSFNLSSFGLSWEDELNLGFHWTMTCANDVIQGDIYKAAVPEPGTMILLGLGVAGLGAAGRKRIARRKEVRDHIL